MGMLCLDSSSFCPRDVALTSSTVSKAVESGGSLSFAQIGSSLLKSQGRRVIPGNPNTMHKLVHRPFYSARPSLLINRGPLTSRSSSGFGSVRDAVVPALNNARTQAAVKFPALPQTLLRKARFLSSNDIPRNDKNSSDENSDPPGFETDPVALFHAEAQGVAVDTYRELWRTIFTNGFPDTFLPENRDKLHDHYFGGDLTKAGWKVQVYWAPSKAIPDTMGLFAAEFIPKGKLLREMLVGINFMRFRTLNDMPKKENKATLDYIGGYIYTVPNLLVSSPLVSHISRFHPVTGIWIPGSGFNHAEVNSNSDRPESPEANVADSKFGAGKLALKDVKPGEELFEDYREFGDIPSVVKQWNELLDNPVAEFNFPGSNDFVEVAKSHTGPTGEQDTETKHKPELNTKNEHEV